MQTHEIHIAGARQRVSEIRHQLFHFPEVLDVMVTSRHDSLVVVVAGRPRPAEWHDHLRSAGYEVLRRTPRKRVDSPPERPALARRSDQPRLRAVPQAPAGQAPTRQLPAGGQAPARQVPARRRRFVPGRLTPLPRIPTPEQRPHAA